MSRRGSTLMLYVGICLLVMTTSWVHGEFVAPSQYSLVASKRLPWAVVYAGVLGVCAYAVGLPDVPYRVRQIVAASVAAVTIALGGVSTLALAVGGPLLPRFVVAVTSIVGAFWFVACSLASRGARSRARKRERVVLIGDHCDRFEVEEELRYSPERPATVVGHLTLDQTIPSAEHPAPVRDAVQDTDGTLVVLDRSAQSSQPVVDQVALLHEDGVRVRTLSLFYEQWLGKLPISELERVSLMFDIGELHRQRYSRLKRLIDVTVAGAMLPLLVMAVPLVAAGNVFANRGPLFFHQERVGKAGRLFRIHKFRTMRPTENGFGEWTSDSDTRVTPWGRLLRLSHLDELPQLLNVIRGDLSLVGPRPEQPRYVAQLGTKLPYYNLRHLVQPGLTGWAQVKFGYGRNESDALQKLQFEFYYLRRQALAVDLRIMARTLRTILPLGGSNGHG